MKDVPEKLKILVVDELDLFKRWLGGVGTVGGIETNHKNLMKGFKERGHTIVVNKEFPAGEKPDLIISPTYGPISIINIWRYKKKYDCACVQHAHTTPDDMKGGFLPAPILPYVDIYLRQLYKFSELIITPSNFSKKSLLKLKIGPRPPIYPVSNGIDLQKFQYSDKRREEFREYLKKEHGIGLEKKVITCVSVIWERKGVDVFHAVAKAFPEHEFVWVGNYLTAKKIKEQFDNLPNLTFTGFVDDVVAAYCGSDVFFFPSRAENQGIPLLEAAACKVPMVCRNLPTYDWLEHDKDCLKANNTKEFKKYLQDIIESNNLREYLVKNALISLQQHDINKILDQVEGLYKRGIKIKNKLREMGR
ncbi:MAG: glycosyltransferase family 4 protein [Candidatus Hodarchaeota archaeon]